MSFEKMWLNYQKNEKSQLINRFMLGKSIYVCISDGQDQENRVIHTAAKELQEAIGDIFDTHVDIYEKTHESVDEYLEAIILRRTDVLKTPDAYHLKERDGLISIEANNGRGVLYGVFDLIRRLQCAINLKGLDVIETPDNPLRMLNHWDNMDGSIERGYSGQSFFFKNHELCINDRTHMYAKLIASVGINATVINNVNVKDSATELISSRYYKYLQLLSEVFANYGIALYLSLNYAAPIDLGGLASADPLDSDVIAWWDKKMSEIYTHLPHLGGFVVKADSEGRPGPFTYGRNQAEGANLLARAIKPYGGTIIWRCFVYNCQQDWRDYNTDRARAGFDYFAPLDGEFLENVVLQIKNGPMDFQVREPVSPLFGAMEHTQQILEVQIAQEYTGQQRHVCYLIPMFKEILDFKTYCGQDEDRVADIVSGRSYGQKLCGMATVANTGNDTNWTGHDLAGANLYGYGRLSFNTSLSAETIAREWIQRTFGLDPEVEHILLNILMQSHSTYEKYTSPLGIGWMVEPNHHYGPNVDGYEYSRWGTYHRADHLGIGVDRTPQGTGYTSQYKDANASMYADLESCPEALVLFFHHLKYTHELKTGKTVIQHIYDTHFEGVSEVETMIQEFKRLQGRIEQQVYLRILARLEEQLESAREWRDQINTYFYRKSGISDKQGRHIF
jgi:alpha-glucuronidase